MKALKKRKQQVGLVILVALVVVVAYFGLATPRTSMLSLFSVSQVDIEPQGGALDQGKLTGCYWVVNVLVDQIDQYSGNRLEIIEAGETAEVLGETVKTRKSLEIKISPEQAFFYRSIASETVPIAEDAYKSVRVMTTGQVWYDMDTHESAVLSGHSAWAESYWHADTTFTVNAWLNGVRITPLTGRTMDTHAGTTAFTIPTSWGDIAFRSLGALTGGVEEPDVGKLLIFNENYIYDWLTAFPLVDYDGTGSLTDWRMDNTKVQQLTGHNNPYSTYWYGEMRWSEIPTVTQDPEVRRTPAGFATPLPYSYTLFAIAEDQYGGWVADDDLIYTRRLPVQPVIFPDQKGSLPLEKRSFLSLTEYLESRNIPNRGKLGLPANQVFRGYTAENNWEIENNRVTVYIDYNAYEVPMLQILVPVELVDTWVWEPPVANLQIEEVGWVSSSSNSISIPANGIRTFWARVRQDSTVEATGRVTASSSNTAGVIAPSKYEPTVAPGETKLLYFELTNGGVASQQSGTITLISSEILTGGEKDRDRSLTFTLQPAGTGGDTILDITVIDEEEGIFVPGMTVFAQTEGSTVARQTITNMQGYCSFNLRMFEGAVVLSTKETPKYLATSRSIDASSGTSEYVLLVNEKPTAGIPEWIYILGAAVIVIGGLYYYYEYYKPSRSRPRRRRS